MIRAVFPLSLLSLSLFLAGCGESPAGADAGPGDGGDTTDGGDAGVVDAAMLPDATVPPDATVSPDAGTPDAAMLDGGPVRTCDDCDALAACDDTVTPIACTCPVGYEDTNGDGSLCTDIDECTAGTDTCDAIATCTDTDGAFTCACPAGYDDTNGDGSVCTDIDECTAGTDTCDAIATCTDTDGAFTCACPAGYEDTNGDGSVCTDIDECTAGTDTCDAVATCTDTDGAFTCACPAGYDDTNGDGSVCTDIDECAAGTDTCDAIATCTDTDGAFTCACPAGTHDLAGDGSTCEPLALYSSSPFQPFLFQTETETFTTVGCLAVTMPGFTPTGTNSITRHPVTGVVYAVVKVAGGRRLATLDLATGIATDVGALGDNFSSIAFTPDGTTLYGVTGDGATVRETLYTIDPTTGARTLVQALGNGADGEVIAFDGAGTLYHWSGNGTVVTETIQIGVGVTDVPFPVSGETFGAVWWGWHTDSTGAPDPVMLISTIASNFRTLSPTAGYSAAFGSLPDDGRGLVFAPDHGYVLGATACPAPITP